MGTGRDKRLAVVAALWLAPACHMLSLWLMHREIEPFYTGFYSLAWWSYIFFISALNHRRNRNSLIFDRPREFVWVFLVSTPAWLFFEVCNFRLQNWHYIGVPEEFWIRLPGYFVAFGTVLPGVLETRSLLANSGLKLPPGRSRRVPSSRERALLASAGGAMLVAALMRTDLFFPLVWVGPIFLFDWLLFRVGEREKSLASMLARGDHARLVQWLAAGLLCGLLWEFWNYWAGAKWIYSIPYFNGFALFEMPLAGFLGFPPFALQCYLIYELSVALKTRISETPARAVLITTVYLAACFLVLRGIDQATVLEFKPFWPEPG